MGSGIKLISVNHLHPVCAFRFMFFFRPWATFAWSIGYALIAHNNGADADLPQFHNRENLFDGIAFSSRFQPKTPWIRFDAFHIL